MGKDTITQILKLNAKQLAPLSSERIKSESIASNELIFFKTENGEMGPYYYKHLQGFTDNHKSFPRDTPIRTMNSKEWVPFYSLAFFDRRQAPSESLTSETGMYVLLVNGQEAGPYDIDELKAKVKNKEVLLTDIVSVDLGKTWNKVYNIPDFDRRQREQEALPYRPDDKTFIISLKELAKEQNEPDDNQDALVKLALIGHVKANSVSKESVHAEEEDEEFDNFIPDRPKLKKSGLSIAISIMLTIGGYFFASNDNKSEPNLGPAEVAKKSDQEKEIKTGTATRSSDSIFKRKPASEKPKKPQVRRPDPVQRPERKPLEPEDDEPIYEDESVDEETDLFNEEEEAEESQDREISEERSIRERKRRRALDSDLGEEEFLDDELPEDFSEEDEFEEEEDDIAY